MSKLLLVGISLFCMSPVYAASSFSYLGLKYGYSYVGNSSNTTNRFDSNGGVSYGANGFILFPENHVLGVRFGLIADASTRNMDLYQNNIKSANTKLNMYGLGVIIGSTAQYKNATMAGFVGYERLHVKLRSDFSSSSTSSSGSGNALVAGLFIKGNDSAVAYGIEGQYLFAKNVLGTSNSWNLFASVGIGF